MDVSFVHIASTVMGFICFIAICLYAYSGGAATKFEEAANIPFDDDDLPQGSRSDAKQG